MLTSTAVLSFCTTSRTVVRSLQNTADLEYKNHTDRRRFSRLSTKILQLRGASMFGPEVLKAEADLPRTIPIQTFHKSLPAIWGSFTTPVEAINPIDEVRSLDKPLLH